MLKIIDTPYELAFEVQQAASDKSSAATACFEKPQEIEDLAGKRTASPNGVERLQLHVVSGFSWSVALAYQLWVHYLR